MNLPSKIRFADKKIKKTFFDLKAARNDDQKLYGWLVKAFQDIEENAFCGIQIPKRLILPVYLKKYKIHNLWKYNLPCSWRLIYSIENQEVIIVSIVLEWMDHKSYEKKFKY